MNERKGKGGRGTSLSAGRRRQWAMLFFYVCLSVSSFQFKFFPLRAECRFHSEMGRDDHSHSQSHTCVVRVYSNCRSRRFGGKEGWGHTPRHLPRIGLGDFLIWMCIQFVQSRKSRAEILKLCVILIDYLYLPWVGRNYFFLPVPSLFRSNGSSPVFHVTWHKIRTNSLSDRISRRWMGDKKHRPTFLPVCPYPTLPP